MRERLRFGYVVSVIENRQANKILVSKLLKNLKYKNEEVVGHTMHGFYRNGF